MIALPAVKTLRGSQGSWDVSVTYVDGSKEVLPTAHQLFWKVDQTGPYYQRVPTDLSWEGFRQHAKFADHVALLSAKKRVVLTTDDINETRGFQTHRLCGRV